MEGQLNICEFIEAPSKWKRAWLKVNQLNF